MLIAIICAYVVLIFPIYSGVRLKFDNERKIVFFKLKLYGFITILNGFIQITSSGILVQYTKKKHKLYRFSNLSDIKGGMKPIKDYHLIHLSIDLHVGDFDDLENALILTQIYQSISEEIFFAVNLRKPYIKFKQDLRIYEGERSFKLKVKLGILFNLLMIFLSLFKIVFGKVTNGLLKQN